MASGERLALGILLRRARRAAGLTQEEVAERAGVSVHTISTIERGVSQVPHKDTVALLAEALGLESDARAAFVQAAGRVRGPDSLGPTRAGILPGALVPPFVGRQGELALLERHLSGQGPPLLLLAGEPGIGKTRLLQAAIPRAAAQGWRVLEGGCSRRGGQEPYAPVLEALQRHLRSQSPAELRVQLRGCAWLVRLLPELADGPIEPLPAWTVPPEQERRLMVEAVVRFLTNITGLSGTVLLLDDLQWAGQDALDLLATLVRSAAEVPLRVLGAYRDTEVVAHDPLAVLLADLAHAGLAGQRSLGPLDPEEARALLEALLSAQDATVGALAEAALQRMGGVPFFAVSWARSLQDPGATGAVPWSVAQSIRQRVAALPALAQDVLGTAAVLGRVVSRPLLVRTCRLEPAIAAVSIEAACRARLLEEEGAAAYRFVHDIIREVVESDLGSARRAVLHQRAGEALEELSGMAAVEALAYHFDRGEEPGRAVGYLEQAADKARAQHAHEAAASYYRALIARLDGMDRPGAVAAACEQLGEVLVTLARYDEALEVLERAAAHHAAAGEPEGLGRVSARIGFVLGQKGAPGEGLARLGPLLGPLEAGGPSPALAELYTAQSRLYFMLYLPQEELAAATRALAVARAVRDNQLLAKAVVRQGNALISAGRVAQSLEALEEACRLAESLGDLSCLCLAHVYASIGRYALGELQASVRCAEMALDVARRLDDPQEIANALSFRSRSAFLMGDWNRARVDLESAMALVRQSSTTHAFFGTAAFLGEYHLAAGEWDEAERYLHEVTTATERGSSNHGRLRHAHGLLAELDLSRGHPQAARARLLPLQEAENSFATWLRTQLAWAYVELGEASRAAELVAWAIAQARSQGHLVRLVDALRVQAMVLVALGRADQAAATLDEGLTLTPRLPYPYGEARLLHLFGHLYMAQGAHQPARERLQDALAIFRRLGARKDSERTEQDIANLPS